VSEQAVAVVRRALEHFIATGEPDWALLHEQIETHDHDILDAGEYRGHAGFGRWLQDWAGAWSEFSLEPAEEYIDAGQRVIVVFGLTATGRSSGVTVERKDAMLCEVRGGQIVRIDYYNNREQALEQAGLGR